MYFCELTRHLWVNELNDYHFNNARSDGVRPLLDINGSSTLEEVDSIHSGRRFRHPWSK